MLFLLRSHAIAVVFALFVGLLYGLPNVIFMFSLGDGYQGIPLFGTPNEESYLARIHEVIDGHGALGSPFFFEYKDQSPLAPPTGEWLYALPSLIFGISTATVLATSKFILPTVLFLLVYALMFRLTRSGGLSQKLNAVACGLFVVLGYDLVDYRTVLSYLGGTLSPGSFLLWARPIHPILGGIFLFSFLISIVALIQQTKRQKSTIFLASLFLALMFGSYFFSWGTALSVLAMLIALFLVRKNYKTAGTLALTIPLGMLFALPYWYGAWQASQSPLYESSILRLGLFYTHYPILNKFLFIALILFVLTLVLDFWWKRRKGIAFRLEEWHFFTLALLLGGLWAYSQQVITGRTVWPYHFVQYTIPLAMVAGFALLYNVVGEWRRYIWGIVALFVAGSSLLFGVYVQASAYTLNRPAYAARQDYMSLFTWLNEQEKDCVVFVNETRWEMSYVNTLIPAFTHCNRYASTELYGLIPEERGLNNYLARLRLRGITSDGIAEYFKDNRGEAAGYLFSNWKGLFGVKDFPDFSDPLLEERLEAFPGQYREYMTRDFRTELEKYKINYILSDEPLLSSILQELPGMELTLIQDMYLYRVR